MYKRPGLKSFNTKNLLDILGPSVNQYSALSPTTGDSGYYIDGYGTSEIMITNTCFLVGDNLMDQGLRGFVGFDISGLSGKTVTSATLRVYQASTTADDVNGESPYGSGQLGSIVVDHVDFGSTLDTDDFDGGTLTSNIGTILTESSEGWKTLDVTSYVQADINSGRPASQFRLRFSSDTDNDGKNDVAAFDNSEDTYGTGNVSELLVDYQ